MTSPARGADPGDPPPVAIPPPTEVKAAAALVLAEAAALVVIGVLTGISGFGNAANTGQLLGQVAYYLVLAAGFAWVATALLRGRRWGRTPALVIQIITLGVGFYLAVPSGRPGWGIAVALVGIGAGWLLLSRPATAWISRFPPLFGPAPDQ